jgi:uncharacterized membrane protein YccC
MTPSREATPPDVPTSRLYVARTTLATLAALLLAQLVGLPEPYWAAITTLVVMQSSLVASWAVSWKRLVGTAIGAVVGGAVATVSSSPNALLFAATLFVSGLLCVVARLDRIAYRFTGITLAIIMLIAHSQQAWILAAHRFADVAIGIAVALGFTLVWPERTT